LNILVYGGGAVGLGIASCLLEAGSEVVIVSREETVNALRGKGLLRTGLFGRFHSDPASFECVTTLKEAPFQSYDFILVCTKAHGSPLAARDLASVPSLVGENSHIVLIQNGWGSAEIFSSYFSREKILSGRIITGFIRPEAHQVEVTVHADAIKVGSLFGDVPHRTGELCESISRYGIPCEKSEAIEKDLWAKMLYNCALNPLGAILGVTYGALGEGEWSKNVMGRVIEEAFKVMIHSGFTTHWDSPGEYVEAFYGKFLPPTVDHESSMLQDIRAGKDTEIDYLNGMVVKLGEKAGLPVPCNWMLCQMIRFLEKGKVD